MGAPIGGEIRLDRRVLAAQAALLGGMLGAAALLATTSLRLPLVCPLRLLTGIPCPLCGMTTGTVALFRRQAAAAAAANPLSLGFVPLAALGLADRLVRLVRRARPRLWPRWARTAALPALGVALAGSWVFQLVRFGII